MEKLAKVFLEGIHNNMANTHKYPWVGLDENKHLIIVFEKTSPTIKEFEQALQHLSAHDEDYRALYSTNHFQEFTQFNIPYHAGRLHNLLLKENPYYAQHHHQGSILSILYPNRPSLKIDAICIGPIHPETLRIYDGGRQISETIADQLSYHLHDAQKPIEGHYHSPSIDNIMNNHQGAEHIKSIIQELTGLASLDSGIHHYGMHPDCLIVAMTEDAKFIYANHTAIPYDELDNFQSLEISYDKFMSHFVDKLKIHLEHLEKNVETLISKNNPQFIIEQLQHEKNVYSEHFHTYQNHPELKQIKLQIEALTPILGHMNVFDHLRSTELLQELQSHTLINPDWQEKLRDLYQKILDGHPNGITEFSSFRDNLQNTLNDLKQKMDALENNLMRPLMNYISSTHIRSNFFEQGETPRFDQQRLKHAIEQPHEIPQIINQLDRLIAQHRMRFENAQNNQVTLIKELKAQLEKIEGTLTPIALAFSHKS